MANSNNVSELENRVLYLETKVRHLTNDLRVTEEENEAATERYLEIHSNMERIIEERTKNLHRAVENLKKSEEKYRSILESIEEGYYEVDLNGDLTFFNDAICNITGYTKRELTGANSGIFMSLETQKAVAEAFKRVNATGKSEKNLDCEYIVKDGTRGYAEISVSLMKDVKGEPTGFRGVVRDISEKKRAESLFRRAQNMEAISTLAGGIAHVFNNTLMGITGNIELLKMDLPQEQGQNAYFEKMKFAARRMIRLTDQLLAYAEGGKYRASKMVLGDFIRDALPILEYTLSPEIRVETDFPRDIHHTMADATQLQMVLSAVLANAKDAIQGDGRIIMSIRNEYLDETFVNDCPDLIAGPYVCLIVKDDGRGMDEETKRKVFDPFFSTKFEGRGMGMAAAYGIVRNHQGWIGVESELGKGTVVRIWLPALVADEETVEEKNRKPATGMGTVLVIEDEEDVMFITRAMLERLGYRVLEARTGNEGVEIAKTFSGHIDLALLDIKLPDMPGAKVHPLIMAARPGLKVIVSSGYSIEGPVRELLDSGADGFIKKPFSAIQLSEKLKEVFKRK
jgi:two-component system cell cycle sensor histidine kinase/response regulator CckA